MKAIPPDWRNIGRVAKRVRKGDSIVVEVEGGFVRKPAPCDGSVVKTVGGDELFVPDDGGLK